MDWKALLIIGGMCLVLGLVLYVPAHYWAKRRLRRAPQESSLKLRITPAGFVVYGLMVAAMMAGFSLQYLAPETRLGHFTSTGRGRIVMTGALMAVVSVVEGLLRSLGVKCVEPQQAMAHAAQQDYSGAAVSARKHDAAASPPERSGYLRVATVWGIPFFIHWSFPMGGLIVAAFGGVDPTRSVYYCLAYTLLIAIHETGHVAAARLLGLRVFAVEISGTGGLCRTERPRRIGQSALVYSAGLLAQAALLLATYLYIAIFGSPVNDLGVALFTTFTVVNAFLIVFNLVPHKSLKGLATDGFVLWRLFLHAYKGHPHPHPPLNAVPLDQSPVFPPDTRLHSIPAFVPPGFVHGIEILNDRTTPMEFVVRELMRHLNMNREEAIATMIAIHTTGGLLIALPSAQLSESIATAITSEATKLGLGFVCRHVDIQQARLG